jgi:hypothetical protein
MESYPYSLPDLASLYRDLMDDPAPASIDLTVASACDKVTSMKSNYLRSRYVASWCSGFDEGQEPEYTSVTCRSKRLAESTAVARGKARGCAEWIGVTYQIHNNTQWETVERWVGDWSGIVESVL